MQYICNRFSVILAIIMIVAALSFSEYRCYQITKQCGSRFSNVCIDQDVTCMFVPEPTWVCNLWRKYVSTDYASYKSVTAIEFVCEPALTSEGVPQVAQVAIEMWNISEIRFPIFLPEQEILDELDRRFPSVTLIGPDDKPIL